MPVNRLCPAGFTTKARRLIQSNPLLCGILGLGLAGCTLDALPFGVPGFTGALPAMPWDARPEAAVWTEATLLAVQSQDSVLAARVPADIDLWCPGYAKGSNADRQAFWAALIALTAKPESGFNPAAVGPGGYYGLMQISPRTAANAGCAVSTKAELKDGENNLFCAVQILSGKVAADGAAVGAKGNRGIGRDWMPWRKAAMRSSSAKWLKQQAYCK